MFIPENFALIDRAAILDVIAAHPLAMLATNAEDGPLATQLPLVMETDAKGRDWICGHFARANPHWRAASGAPSLAVFRGEQGYVHPGWYPTKAETGKVVPTWNYVTVQARGPVTIVEGEETRRIVALLTNAMEARRPRPWAMEDAPPAFTDALLRGVVAFRMEVRSLKGKAKLSQNKGEADYEGVRSGLRADGETALADAMDG